MSMDNDTRLMMMHLNDRTRPAAPARRQSRVRRYSATAATTMAAFALTLFTRGV